MADGEAALARQLLEREEWLLLQQAGAAAAEHTQQAAAAEQTQHLRHQKEAATEQQQQQQKQAAAEQQLGACRAPCPPEDAPDYDRSSWEGFHAQHSAARFFKERRYLLLEFPQLATSDPPQHFVEIGCGCGSSLLPVLRANPTCRCVLCGWRAPAPAAAAALLLLSSRLGRLRAGHCRAPKGAVPGASLAVAST